MEEILPTETITDYPRKRLKANTDFGMFGLMASKDGENHIHVSLTDSETEKLIAYAQAFLQEKDKIRREKADEEN